jgi:hypothetical protein
MPAAHWLDQRHHQALCASLTTPPPRRARWPRRTTGPYAADACILRAELRCMNIHQAGRLHVEPTAGLLAADIAKAPLILRADPAPGLRPQLSPARCISSNWAAITRQRLRRQMPRYCRSVCAESRAGSVSPSAHSSSSVAFAGRCRASSACCFCSPPNRLNPDPLRCRVLPPAQRRSYFRVRPAGRPGRRGRGGCYLATRLCRVS